MLALRVGIFARTFKRTDLPGVLDAVCAHGLGCTQFNLSCAGMESLPEELTESACHDIHQAFSVRELETWQLMLISLAGWLNRHQQAVIDYIKEENRILKEQLGGKRPQLNDGQRRRLAVLGKALGRKVLSEMATIVTPDTILGWHRQLIARHWTYTRRSPGRPRTMKIIAELILMMARENPLWGYTSIRDRLQNLGHKVGRTTIANILLKNGLEPAPRRSKWTSWTTFLKSHCFARLQTHLHPLPDPVGLPRAFLRHAATKRAG